MLAIKIMPQPDDHTCGPTSLHAVYNYYGDKISLSEVINEISYLDAGGTLAVFLGCHALKRGYYAIIHTFDLKVFDPTWFSHKKVNIIQKLKEQLKYKKSKKLHKATEAYIEFLKLKGKLVFENLTPALLRNNFSKGIPILAGLSATYLYQCAREYDDGVDDDIRGYPTGHFVVLSGYDDEKKHVVVADPYTENPVSKDNYYTVKVDRLINAILLGIITYDANLLIIKPKEDIKCLI